MLIVSQCNGGPIKEGCLFLIIDGGWFTIQKITEKNPQDEAGLIEINGEGIIEVTGEPFSFSMIFNSKSKRGHLEIIDK